ALLYCLSSSGRSRVTRSPRSFPTRRSSDLTLPIVEFGMYWFLHITALVVPIMFMWGLGYRPTWRGYGFTYAATLLWAGIAICVRSEEHTSELQSRFDFVCRLLLEKKYDIRP